MGVLVDAQIDVRHAHICQQLAGFRQRGLAAQPIVLANDLHDLTANRIDRVECLHRFLEDHGNLFAAQRAHVPLAERQQWLAVEQDGASDREQVGVEQAHQGLCGQAFAAAGLTHDAECLVVSQTERHAANQRRRQAFFVDGNVQVGDFEQRRLVECIGNDGHGATQCERCLRSMWCLRLSPTRLMAITNKVIASPGKMQIHGATLR